MKLYNVHVKHITASEARKNWFRILDEVVAGETVVLERHGHRVLIQRAPSRVSEPPPPNYAAHLKVVDRAEHADEWSWDWSPARGALRPATRRKK